MQRRLALLGFGDGLIAGGFGLVKIGGKPVVAVEFGPARPRQPTDDPTADPAEREGREQDQGGGENEVVTRHCASLADASAG